MLTIMLMMTTTVGGFSYRIETLSDQTKRLSPAPSGFARTWREHVEAIVATRRNDADFSHFMRQQAIRLKRNYYREAKVGYRSFKTFADPGSIEVSESVISASPEIVSASIGTSYIQADMPHFDAEGATSFIWSRRLHRLFAQEDVFAVPPDRALRQLAQSRFDNRDNLQNPDAADGLPLSWDHASIGPYGITWTFGPYELGGYESGGAASVSWSALRHYLRDKLPFVISAIRVTATQARGSSCRSPIPCPVVRDQR